MSSIRPFQKEWSGIASYPKVTGEASVAGAADRVPSPLGCPLM
jgi:hypothetical protein